MRRFFVPSENITGNSAIISGSDTKHVKEVLRMNIGDEIELLDGSGNVYLAKITEFKKDEVLCDMISTRVSKSEPKVSVAILQGLPKGQKMDMIVQKLTEIGASRVIPVITERTVPQLSKEKESKKVLRWQKIAKEASEQAARGIVPKVEEIKSFDKAVLEAKDFDLALIPWEMEEEKTLKEILKKNNKAQKIIIAIGPEGGFSESEISMAKRSGFIPVTLGKRVLRTETAGIVALAKILYEFEG